MFKDQNIIQGQLCCHWRPLGKKNFKGENKERTKRQTIRTTF